MATSATSAGEGPRPPNRFATTHWTVVVAAGRSHTTAARAALEELCKLYWYPLYAFVRRRGSSPEERAKGETLNGSISSDYPELEVTKQFPVGNHLNGSVGDGSCDLKVNTVNGAVAIKKARPVQR